MTLTQHRRFQLHTMPIDELREWYAECSATQIAEAMDTNENFVRRVLEKRGLRKAHTIYETQRNKKRYVKQILSGSITVVEMARKLGRNRKTIQRWIRSQQGSASTRCAASLKKIEGAK